MRNTEMMREAVQHPYWARFVKFDQDNPAVWTWLVDLIRDCQRRGMTRLGARYLGERCRYEAHLEIETDEPVKLNSNLLALYSRAIVFEHPEMAGMFEFRDLTSI